MCQDNEKHVLKHLKVAFFFESDNIEICYMIFASHCVLDNKMKGISVDGRANVGTIHVD